MRTYAKPSKKSKRVKSKWKIKSRFLSDEEMERIASKFSHTLFKTPSPDSTITLRVGQSEIRCVVPDVDAKRMEKHENPNGRSTSTTMRNVSKSKEDNASERMRPHLDPSERRSRRIAQSSMAMSDTSSEETTRGTVMVDVWAFICGIVVGLIIALTAVYVYVDKFEQPDIYVLPYEKNIPEIIEKSI